MFADRDRLGNDVDWLHDACRQIEPRDSAAAIGAHAQRVVNLLVDLFGCEWWPLVSRVSRLPAAFAFAGRTEAGSWRLDNVARRGSTGLGGVDGVLLRRGQLRLPFGNQCQQGNNLVFKNGDALLKQHAIRTAMIPRHLHPAELHNAQPG